MYRSEVIGSSFVALALALSACQDAPAPSAASEKEPAAEVQASSAEPSKSAPAAAEAPTEPTAPAAENAAPPNSDQAEKPSESAAKNSGLLPFAADKKGMSPMPASALRTRLEAIQKKLDLDKVWQDEATSEQLTAALPPRVGDYLSLSLPDTSAQGAQVPGRAATREYQHNETVVHAIIYDAGKTPDMRRLFSEYLTLVGDESQGRQQPFVMKGGVPGMEAYMANMQLSYAAALVNERHMVVIVARPTNDPNAGRKFLERLDLAPLP